MTTSTRDETAGGLADALAGVRDELERMCRWRRDERFSVSEQSQWNLLGIREMALIAELKAVLAGDANRACG